MVFKSYEIDNTETTNDSLINISKKLCLKYRDFFNINKAEQQPPHQPTNHTIELKPGFKLSYM